MSSKLTLRIDERLIKKAKAYARKKGKSVSALVADYFSLLEVERDKREELPPKVLSLRGILKDKEVSLEDYKRHLEEKYL